MRAWKGKSFLGKMTIGPIFHVWDCVLSKGCQTDALCGPNAMMCCFANDARRLLPVLLLLAALGGPASHAADTNGPTIHLRCGAEEAANPVADFMYFVPLISPNPVASFTSPGSTQSVRVISSKHRLSAHSFTTTCEIELQGDGRQQNVFDLAPAIHRHESQLQNGGSLKRQLKSIDVQGAGAITVEVEGALSNGVSTVNQVRLRFNSHGHTSPVWINLCDIRRSHDDFRPANEIWARVNTLTFRRQPGPPTMEVSVASIKHKESGDGFWQNFKGRMDGVAVNLFIHPLTVEAAGHQAMLDFGQALVAGAPTFTFPRARNLQAGSVP
jgi:hypothetical protein